MIYVTTYGDIYVLNIGFIYVCSVWVYQALLANIAFSEAAKHQRRFLQCPSSSVQFSLMCKIRQNTTVTRQDRHDT